MKELKSEVKNDQKVRDVLFLEGDHLQFHISVYEEFNNFFFAINPQHAWVKVLVTINIKHCSQDDKNQNASIMNNSLSSEYQVLDGSEVSKFLST